MCIYIYAMYHIILYSGQLLFSTLYVGILYWMVGLRPEKDRLNNKSKQTYIHTYKQRRHKQHYN